MKNLVSKNMLAAIMLAAIIAILTLVIWELLLGVTLYYSSYISFENFTLSWWQGLILVGWAILFAVINYKYPAKKLLPYTAGLIIFWFIASTIAIAYFSTNLMFVRVFCITVLTLVAVHLRKLWEIDSELTERLVSVSTTGHLLEAKSADVRIESGLKLLETVLPLSEAIIFNFNKEGELIPTGRSRNVSVSDESLSERQAAWRKSVRLCEQAISDKETLVQIDDEKKKSAQIAIPLRYEENTIGVLYVKVRENFEREDRYLLEAFSGQLAQNFQRHELRSKDLPHKYWWNFLSTHSANNRLDVISLINSSMKEQTFSTIAGSYLREAHAVAYLDGTLAYLNRQMRHLAKVAAHQIHDLDLFGLLENFKTEIFNEPRLAIRRVLQSGEIYKCELYFPDTGKTLKMQISLVKVPSDSQSIHDTNVPMKPACFLITMRDITAVKENERLRSDMTSLMSHELRTPITSIKGFAELLLMDETMSEESREFLTIISNESQRLSKMLTTFLSVSNLEQSDKQEVTKTPVRLDSVVSEVVVDLKENAKQKRIRLIEQSNSHLPPIAADKGLITRAVSNLIDNAIRYSPERTSVIISTILESEFLRVVVEDRGYGIPKSEQEKIWQKFYRVARDGQDKGEESTGLGLSLVKEIIEQHGGAVEVESELDFGSKFSFTLPRL